MIFLANLLTILNFICGFLSIIFSLESRFTLASWLIILSVILDGLDGQAARLNPASNQFGRELDSLADLISFGVAPVILGYTFVYRQLYLWGIIALFIYLLCGVIRLARFKVTAKEKLENYFYGLPITVSGGILASFILSCIKYNSPFTPAIFIFIVLALALLMVSRFRYLNLSSLTHLLGRRKIIIFSVIASGAAVFLPEISIFALFLIYLTISPFIVRLLDSN